MKDVSLSWPKGSTEVPNLGVPVVLILMVSTVMMAVLTLVAARSLDRSAESSAQQLARSLLLETRRDLAKVARDVSGADFARAFATGGGGPRQSENEIGDYLFRTFGVSSSWIIDRGDRTAFGQIGGEATSAEAFHVMPAGLDRLLQRARAAPSSVPSSVHGLLLFNGNIHVVAAAAIASEQGAREPVADIARPVLVITHALELQDLAVMDAVYFMNGVEFAGRPSAIGEPAVRLEDPNGDTLGYLVVNISAPGTVLLRQVWPAVASAFASMLLLVGLFVRRVERARLQRVQLVETLDRERDLRQMQARFINMVSHEIRTPLTTIRAATDLLARYYPQMDSQDRDSELKAIQREIEVITELVEDVLAIGRTEGEDFELQPERLDLEALSREILEKLERINGRQHSIDLKVDAQVRDVLLDPSLLRSILTNLLGNAMKFSPDATPVQVDLGASADGVTIRVTDHGIGIPIDQQEAIFSPFNRASNVGAISGTGLGLTITKQSVERHGGTLHLSSEEGKGTEVMVRLPLAS